MEFPTHLFFLYLYTARRDRPTERPTEMVDSSRLLILVTRCHIYSPRGSIDRSGYRSIRVSVRNSWSPPKTYLLALVICVHVALATSTRSSSGHSTRKASCTGAQTRIPVPRDCRLHSRSSGIISPCGGPASPGSSLLARSRARLAQR